MTRSHALAALLSCAGFAGVPAVANAQELSPFTIPWNDGEPGPTSLASMSTDGALPRVSVGDDGHLYAEGQRVRFWGVNCIFEACFPTHEQAKMVAKRLRKFGINAMRFHHIDPPWFKLLIDYNHPDGTSQHFDEERLDRLDYFIFQLQSQGIYINLNLHVSRFYTEADGFPGFVDPAEGFSEGMMQAQKILATFDVAAQELDKDYATQLLLHENPYTGSSYATDPGVAFIEILNEAALIHGTLEVGGLEQSYFDLLPLPYQDGLREQWNSWLSDTAGYTSTEELLVDWGLPTAPPAELLLDTGFDDFALGSGPWVLVVQEGAEATATVVPDADGVHNAVVIDTTMTHAESWRVGLRHTGLTLQEGELYTLSFRARGDSERPIHWNIIETETFTAVGPALTQGALTTDWTEYRTTFIASAEAAAANEVIYEFTNLAASLGEVWLSQPSLEEGEEPLLVGQSLEAGTFPLLSPASSSSVKGKRQWFHFLRDIESAYFSEMRSFLQVELGTQSLLIGTTGMNSPPSVQSQFDIMDTHSYWNLPVFPSGFVTTDDWYVERSSVVNSPPSLIKDVAGVAVRGKPQFITEFNDTQPNPLSGDAAVIIGAYAALQDWDGVFFFDLGQIMADHVEGYSDIGANPRVLANLLVGARMFRNFDVAASSEELLIGYDANTELTTMTSQARAWEVAHAEHVGTRMEAALISKLRLDLEDGATSSPLPDVEGMSIFESDTGELVWDVSNPERGVITVTTPHTRAVTGYSDGLSYVLEDVTIEAGTTRLGRSTIALTLLEGDSFLGDARALVTATGDQRNTGQDWSDATETSLQSWGWAPTLIETVPATITFARPASEVRAWALGPEGQRAAEVAVTGDDTSASLVLGESIPTLWYEVKLGAGSGEASSSDLMLKCEAFCAAPDSTTLGCFASDLDCQAWCTEEHAKAASRECGCEEKWNTAIDCATEAAEGACEGESRFDSEGDCAAELSELDKCYDAKAPCIEWQVDLIDDFEDGDDQIIESRGRQGKWVWAMSEESSVGQDPPLPGSGGALDTSQALHLTGTNAEWMHLDVTLKDGSAYDASLYEGVGFYAKGRGELRLEVLTQSLIDADAWGSTYRKSVVLSERWEHFVLPFIGSNAFEQPQLTENPEALDTSEIVELWFSPSQGSFELSLDEVSFLALPETQLDAEEANGDGGSNGMGDTDDPNGTDDSGGTANSATTGGSEGADDSDAAGGDDANSAKGGTGEKPGDNDNADEPEQGDPSENDASSEPENLNSSKGCGCRTVGAPPQDTHAGWLLILLAVLTQRRYRERSKKGLSAEKR